MIHKYLETVTSVESIRFPNRESPIGKMINDYLASTADMDDHTIHLLFSANRWEASKEIESKLNSGSTLICDRYAYSGVAYTSAKGYDVEWCKRPDSGLPQPDAVIFLDMPVENASKRGNYGEERYEKIDFQKKIREKYLELKSDDNGKVTWYTINADNTIDNVHNEIKNITDKVIEDVKTSKIKKLWI